MGVEPISITKTGNPTGRSIRVFRIMFRSITRAVYVAQGNQLRWSFSAMKIGQPADIVVLRKMKRVKLTITPGSRE